MQLLIWSYSHADMSSRSLVVVFSPRVFTVVIAVVMAVTGCSGIPVDPEGTLGRASGGTLRVGMSQEKPWTAVEGGERSGVEVRLVEEFAAGVGAEVEWHVSAHPLGGGTLLSGGDPGIAHERLTRLGSAHGWKCLATRDGRRVRH